MSRKDPFYFRNSGGTTHNRKIHLADDAIEPFGDGKTTVWAIVGESSWKKSACRTKAPGVVLTIDRAHVTCLKCKALLP